ncbi:benenodin family lasso peptide, partial [Campylobacter jejuni]
NSYNRRMSRSFRGRDWRDATRRVTMECINEDAIDLIDLGEVSVETQGGPFTELDGVGYQLPIGLSVD